MKPFYLLAIFTCMFSVAAFAQQKTDVEFGVQAGYTRSGVDLGAGSEGSRTINGFNAGIYADMYFSDSWSFKAKVLYDQKGFAQRYILEYAFVYSLYYSPGSPNFPVQTTYDNIKINYLTIPLTADWHFGHGHRWYLGFGPYIGVLLSAKDTKGSPPEDIKYQYNTIDAGLALGIGFKIPIAKHLKLFVECDGQNGVTGSLNSPGSTGNNNYQNARGSLNVGISF